MPADPSTFAIRTFADVLMRVASGDMNARAPRTGDGDPLDVLAFMINATIEEVSMLMDDIRRDQAELRMTQDQLVHADKLSSLGLLAGGVAHELNQPLTAIRVLVGMQMQRVESGGAAPAREELALLEDAAHRMSEIIDGIRTFARQDSLQRRPIPLDLPARHALQLMGASMRQHGIVVHSSFPDKPPEINVDSARLQQVLINLLSNARDALAGQKNHPVGRIRLEASTQGDTAVFIVEDDGPGVSPEIIERIFDPFFTTKDVGDGTGLGLSISYGIVKEHGGTLTLAPATGRGARFIVRIPRISMETP